MSEKRDLLASMDKEQLIKIIGAERALLAKRRIEIDPSSDDETLRQDLAKLNLRTIRKHARKLGISITEEQIVEETVSRKTIARTTAAISQDTITEEVTIDEVIPHDKLLIELVKLESQGLTKDYVIRWAQDKKLPFEERQSLIQTLEQFDDNFLWDIHLAFTKSKSGRGLEFQFAHWLRNHSALLVMGRELYKRDSIKLRHRITGRSGVTHEVDIYAVIDSWYEGRVMKETIHPGAQFLISCKSTRTKIDKSHIAEWLSIVRDIHLHPDNMMDGVDVVAIVSKQGFTPDAIRFARANPISTFGYNEKDETYFPIVRAPLLLFEQRCPTEFMQVLPTEEDVTYFAENLFINLKQPYNIKSPKKWAFLWLLPDARPK